MPVAGETVCGGPFKMGPGGKGSNQAVAAADFVKTSIGFGPGGAIVRAVRLMRKTVGPTMGVKSAGGIHTQEEAKQMIEAGATRIGASAGIAIATGK